MLKLKKDNYKQQWKLTDFSKKNVELSTIIDVSHVRDKPQSILVPRFRQEKGSVELFSDNSPVISVHHGDIHRAYPLSLLLYHQVVHDELDGLNIVVTYCPFSNSCAVYQNNFHGEILDFGNTRKLRFGNSLMFDKKTESWWQQATGQALVGEYSGSVLEPIMFTIQPFSVFKKHFPDGEVLTPAKQSAHAYGMTPYSSYDTQNKAAVYPVDFPYENLSPLEYVFVIGGQAIALPYLQTHPHVELGNTLIEYHPDMPSVLDQKRIINSRNIGYITLSPLDESMPFFEQYDMPFAFMYHAFNPDTPIFYET